MFSVYLSTKGGGPGPVSSPVAGLVLRSDEGAGVAGAREGR